MTTCGVGIDDEWIPDAGYWWEEIRYYHLIDAHYMNVPWKELSEDTQERVKAMFRAAQDMVDPRDFTGD